MAEVLSGIPTGFRLKAQGWRKVPTLGITRKKIQLQRSCVIQCTRIALDHLSQPRWGCNRFFTSTQGSSFVATLGFVAQSLWDWGLQSPHLWVMISPLPLFRLCSEEREKKTARHGVVCIDLPIKPMLLSKAFGKLSTCGIAVPWTRRPLGWFGSADASDG
jgi:hypothetical protein